MKKGKVYLVGAGPGDPKLLTLYGLECIQKADVISYDRLVNKEILKYAKEGCELIFSGKRPGNHHLIQDEINQLLVDQALKGKVVTRLKGGDPFVFGRGGEEAEYLANHGIAFEVVPGVTAGIAASAYAGIPVTHRNYATSFAMVTGHGCTERGSDFLNWEALAKGIDTIAFYMGVSNLSNICKNLMTHGKRAATPVAVIHWGTTSVQRTVTGTLETIEEIVAKHEISHPSIILVGEVVQMREKIQWFEENQTEALAMAMA
jgi:uroporphyrin-III C-methyltransferase